MYDETIKYTSATKEGNGGADIVKKKANTIIIEIIGDNKSKPRIIINWRVEYILYKIPTIMNKTGDLSPWKSIIIRILLEANKLLLRYNKGTAIIWETEE